jgi:hypothetical protein
MNPQWTPWMHPDKPERVHRRLTRLVRWFRHLSWMLACGHIKAGLLRRSFGTFALHAYFFQGETVWEIYCGAFYVQVNG